ncbi:MAG: OsmC family peroxiredoxin [Alphaproteobacteria bacterium]|nr:OsmC family peroxiredoxin [Alphaproteobacteria bacterium]
MAGTHRYTATVEWTGNTGTGTSSYEGYERAHEIRVPGKPTIPGSSDPAFRGDPARYNPEDLLVASLSTCHMLWFLHLAATAKVEVAAYVDHAVGTMVEDASGGGRFTEVTLAPEVTLAGAADPKRIDAIHQDAHAKCFIANSVNFPVNCRGSVRSAATH